MTKTKQINLTKNIHVTEAENIDYNHGVRLEWQKFKQFDRTLNGSTYSDQQVRDKVGKNNGWAVCRSWSDIKNKKMCFEVLAGSKKTVVHEVEYKDICKEYGWKSFKWSDDGQMILPTK